MIPIKLSNYTVFEFLEKETVRDLDVYPKLHLYDLPQGGLTSYHFIQSDSINSSEHNLASREYQFSTVLSNLSLNSTPYFYPEENIRQSYHDSTEISNILGSSALPSMEYKNCRLHFKSGFSMNAAQPGVTLSIFVRLSDNTRVYLTSIYDNYLNSSLKITDVPIVHENAIYDQSIDFEIVDLDFIFSSNDEKIIELKNLVFKNERPTTIFFEYSTLVPSNIDVAYIDGKEYVQINRSNIDTFQIDTSSSALDLFLDVQNSGKFITSVLRHSRYDVEQYMNKFKSSTEEFNVIHRITCTEYSSSNEIIGIQSYSIQNEANKFQQIMYRPVINNADADHVKLTVVATVINTSTGAKFQKESRIVISDLSGFSVNLSTIPVNLSTDKIVNSITENVNRIVIENDAPDVVQIIKPVYVTLQQSENTIELLPHEHTVKIQTDIPNLDRLQYVQLQIGNVSVKNTSSDKLTFTIPKQAYYSEADKYYLLSSDGAVITWGKIVRL